MCCFCMYINSFHTFIFSRKKLCKMRLVKNIAFRSKSGLIMTSVTNTCCGIIAIWFLHNSIVEPLI